MALINKIFLPEYEHVAEKIGVAGAFVLSLYITEIVTLTLVYYKRPGRGVQYLDHNSKIMDKIRGIFQICGSDFQRVESWIKISTAAESRIKIQVTPSRTLIR